MKSTKLGSLFSFLFFLFFSFFSFFSLFSLFLSLFSLFSLFSFLSFLFSLLSSLFSLLSALPSSFHVTKHLNSFAQYFEAENSIHPSLRYVLFNTSKVLDFEPPTLDQLTRLVSLYNDIVDPQLVSLRLFKLFHNHLNELFFCLDFMDSIISQKINQSYLYQIMHFMV